MVLLFAKENAHHLSVQLPVFSVLDSQEAADLAVKVYAQKADSGFQSIYRYSRQKNGDTILIRFLDCGRELSAFQRFLMTSLLLSDLGALILFAIVVYFSGRIVRPFAESYEKQKQFGHPIVRTAFSGNGELALDEWAFLCYTEENQREMEHPKHDENPIYLPRQDSAELRKAPDPLRQIRFSKTDLPMF